MNKQGVLIRLTNQDESLSSRKRGLERSEGGLITAVTGMWWDDNDDS